MIQGFDKNEKNGIKIAAWITEEKTEAFLWECYAKLHSNSFCIYVDFTKMSLYVYATNYIRPLLIYLKKKSKKIKLSMKIVYLYQIFNEWKKNVENNVNECSQHASNERSDDKEKFLNFF